MTRFKDFEVVRTTIFHPGLNQLLTPEQYKAVRQQEEAGAVAEIMSINLEDVYAAKEARKREAIERLRAAKQEKLASGQVKPKSKFYYTLIKTFCPGCHSKWETCKSPVEHKAKYVTPYVQAEVKL